MKKQEDTKLSVFIKLLVFMAWLISVLIIISKLNLHLQDLSKNYNTNDTIRNKTAADSTKKQEEEGLDLAIFLYGTGQLNPPTPVF